jgi:S1-C subfamily serine protease
MISARPKRIYETVRHGRILCFSLFLLLALCADAPVFAAKKEKPFIVKVYSTSQSYNSFYPWEKERASQRTAFGVIVENKYILTTSDTVADATYIEVKKISSEEKYKGRVKFVDYSSNLAVIGVDDESFFRDLVSIPLSGRLKKSDKVSILQIQDNNDLKAIDAVVEKISIEQSYLAWDEFLSYLLSVKLENRDHWSEPVIKGGKLAGIITSYDQSRSIADVIPAEVIRHFITDISDGRYDGFPDIGFYWEPLQNPCLKEYLSMDKSMTGVYISRIVPQSSADGLLEKGDVLLTADNKPIDDNGYYNDPVYGKLKLSNLFNGTRFPGDKLTVEILRNGRKTAKELTLKRFPFENYFIPLYDFDRQPKYIIEGGMVIQEVTTDYLKTWGEKWQNKADKRLLYYYNFFSRVPADERKKIVVVSFVLPDDVNIGYQNFQCMIIKTVNGKKVGTIEEVSKIFEQSTEKFMEIVFEGEKKAVFERSSMKEASQGIAGRYNIYKLKNL